MEKQYLMLDEHRAAYVEIGQGPPAVFLHGLFGNALTLYPLMVELQGQYTCISLDLLGFGESSKPQGKYLVDTQVAFLVAFCRAKQLSAIDLIGFSYGAWVAAAFAIANATVPHPQPPTLQRLALIAPAGIRDDNFIDRYALLKPLLWDSPFVDLAIKGLNPFATLLGQNQAFQDICQFRNAIATQPAAKAHLLARLRPEDAVDTVENAIHHITNPTLVIAGGEDPHIPLWHSQTYATQISTAILEVIPGATHSLIDTHTSNIANTIKTHWDKPYLTDTTK